MKIADMNTGRDWYELVKDHYGSAPGTSFIAVSKPGWEQCQFQFNSPEYRNFRALGLPAVILGIPVRIVEDIAHGEIELRHWPDSDLGSAAVVT